MAGRIFNIEWVHTYIKVTHKSFYMKTFFMKVVQIFMEIIFSLLIATKTRRQQLADQNKQQIDQQLFLKKCFKQRMISMKFWITFILNVFI